MKFELATAIPVNDDSIVRLNLSKRTENRLHHAGCAAVSQLIELCDDTRNRCVNGVGEGGWAEIEAALAAPFPDRAVPAERTERAWDIVERALSSLPPTRGD